MTVLENVMTGAFLRTRNRRRAEDKALEVLEFIGLYDKRTLWAETLTLPDKKMVEVARALASEPTLLLLDEALAGLSGAEVNQAVELISKVAKKGMALLVVEHVMEVVMPISDKVVVLDHGAKVAEDKPEAVTNDPRVIEAYLGMKYAAKHRTN
jgi:branched-chain amino acid transport system ATP-binding protein